MRNTSLRTQKYIFFPDKKDVRHLHPGCTPSSPGIGSIIARYVRHLRPIPSRYFPDIRGKPGKKVVKL